MRNVSEWAMGETAPAWGIDGEEKPVELLMPSNIEIKAWAKDLTRKRGLVERLAGNGPTVIRQRDTFFPCASGRLKLRELAEDRGELIAYRRADVAGTKQSDYLLYRTAEPEALRGVLAEALGTGVVVTKTRLLYLVGQTRVHLDDVEGLGAFLELEVVLAEGQAAADGHRIAREIMAALEVREEDLIEGAYADLLAKYPGTQGTTQTRMIE